MKELIEKQAAINAAVDAVDDWDGGYNIEREKMITKAINDLTPINPEIVRCKDCYGNGKCAIQSLVKNDENFFCGDAVRIEEK